MRALPKLAGPRRLLLVGDSKLVSYANLGAIMAAGVDFIAPAAKTYVPAEVLAALEVQAATPVGYVAERDQGKPPGQRGSYRVVEDTMPISGRRTTDPVLRVRRVLVWSSARAGAAATARARKLDRARDDLQRLQRGLGSRHYPTIDKVHARLAAIARSRRVTGLLRAQVGTGQDSGKPTLTWWFDPDALAAEAASDGWYALLTNLDPAQADAAGVLARSKGQEVVERRYGRSRATGGRADVLAVQPSHPGAGHRDLPGPAHLLPGRTPGPPRHRPRPHLGWAVPRPASQAHRAADLRDPGRLAAAPRNRPRPTDHPPTPATASPAP
jgi:hypothetical protein